MTSIPDATNVVLTEEERAELDALARSTKTEHRLRQRARIVLLAAEGVATRAIGREVGCTTGTASKWRAGSSWDGAGRLGRDRAPGQTTPNTRGSAKNHPVALCPPRRPGVSASARALRTS